MICLTVSVEYDDFLEVFLRENARHFGEVWVVTTPNDYATLEVCCAERNDKVRVLTTNAFSARGATFNKGAAIEECLARLEPAGWICLADADIVLPPECDFAGLEPGCLYTAPRRLCAKPADFQWNPLWSSLPLVRDHPFWAGYFLVFHASDPVLASRPWYPTGWKHAGGADTEFCAKWPGDRQKLLPMEVLHLGPCEQNWWGRTTPYQDGIAPAGARAARDKMEAMYRHRRSGTYDFERLP